jgi:outer membrane protein OmpA-like peptidoglycan-associated protein
LKKRAEFQLASDQGAAVDDGTRDRIAKILNNELRGSNARVDASDRGVMVTLPSSSLFASDGIELLPEAKDRVFHVAMALQSLKPDQVVMVAGHTDATGSDTYNQRLSTARAEAIRTYLVSQGVAPDRIQAVGEGEARPIGDNGTAEGRDANRRIEIVIPLNRSEQRAPEPTSSR